MFARLDGRHCWRRSCRRTPFPVSIDRQRQPVGDRVLYRGHGRGRDRVRPAAGDPRLAARRRRHAQGCRRQRDAGRVARTAAPGARRVAGRALARCCSSARRSSSGASPRAQMLDPGFAMREGLLASIDLLPNGYDAPRGVVFSTSSCCSASRRFRRSSPATPWRGRCRSDLGGGSDMSVRVDGYQARDGRGAAGVLQPCRAAILRDDGRPDRSGAARSTTATSTASRCPSSSTRRWRGVTGTAATRWAARSISAGGRRSSSASRGRQVLAAQRGAAQLHVHAGVSVLPAGHDPPGSDGWRFPRRACRGRGGSAASRSEPAALRRAHDRATTCA